MVTSSGAPSGTVRRSRWAAVRLCVCVVHRGGNKTEERAQYNIRLTKITSLLYVVKHRRGGMTATLMRGCVAIRRKYIP